MKPIPVDPSIRAKCSLWSHRTFLPVLAVWSLVSDPLAGALTGQFWWGGAGGPTDTRVAYVNNDGGAQTVNTDNNPTMDLITSSVSDVGLDTAAGFYFAIVNDSLGQSARLIRGGIGSSAAPVVAVIFPSNIIVNALQVDPINKKICTTYQEANGVAGNTGIRQYSYNPLTGAVTDQGFIVRADLDNKPISSIGYDVLDVHDFDLDPSTNTIYFTELLAGEMGLYRLNLATPNTITQMVNSIQFPDDGSNGYIIDVEVDPTTDKVYFTTESQHPFGSSTGYNAAQNMLWTVPQGASLASATAVTLTGLPVGGHFFPGDMIFDQSQRQLYIESEESNSTSTDDVIYVFQLDASGNTATLVNTLTPNPAFTTVGAKIQGMAFDALATLTTTGNPTHGVEQGTPVSLLASDPAIADIDGGHLASATVTLSGSFTGSGDDLFVLDGATHRSSGVVTGTNITVSRTTDGSGNQKLTFTGHDTLANYQQALGHVQLFANGDNPTNFGSNNSRTATWQINDGAAGNPAMTLNAAATNLRSTTFTIDAVNDPPVNVKPTDKSLNEDGSLAIAGFSISDVDAPAASSLTTTLTVSHGILTVAPAGGAAVSGSGTASVTLAGSVAKINTTLASTNNILYKPLPDYSGSDSLVMTTNDGGNTGSPGPLTDTDTVGIAITAVNDNPLAGANSIARFPSLPTNVKIAALLANDTDVDGDTLNFVSAGGAANGTVSIVSDMVIYTPNAGFLTGDSFTYSINDGHGGTATGTVTVTIASGQDIAKIELLPDGTGRISFHGIIGMTYRIQSSDNLSPGSWITRTNLTADAAGDFIFAEPKPLPPRRFYRSIPP